MAFEQYRAAQAIAAATPESRNRYVDLLRAVAILAVVFGHWLMAAVWVDGSGFHARNILSEVEATQWLTWGLQVMPLFFFVGGYSNAASWKGAAGGYSSWLRGRLRRLVLPTVPLIGAWIGLGLIAPQFGLDPALAHLGSQVALIPLWFLAVYVLMVAATPLTVNLWNRYRMRAVLVMTAGALATDAVRAVTTDHVGFVNYAFVWGPVYLLGHAWRNGFFRDARQSMALVAIAGAGLIAMTLAGPYHVSMVGVPGVAFGNTAPPSAALLALALTQIGIALALQRPMRQFLQRPAAWTATVLINGSIMTVYVWHMTAMALAIGAVLLVDWPLLAPIPGSVGWWVTRPLWIGVLAIVTVPFMVAFRRLESGSRATNRERASQIAPLLATFGVGISFFSVAIKGLSTSDPLWAAAAVLPLFSVAYWLRPTTPLPSNRRELMRR